MKDFFLSYHLADEEWATWLAAELEVAGYSTVVAAWDFRPGHNLVLKLQEALKSSRRVLLVLSEDYLIGELTQPQWATVFAQDPSGQRGLLLPVMVKRCAPTGLLAQLVRIELVGLAEEAARGRLLESVNEKGHAVVRRAAFPGTRPVAQRPPFPGDLRSLLHRLPLPLSQMLQRALNSKSSADRHLNAYYLGECALKLAAALRIGLWLDQAPEPGGELAQKIEGLVFPEPAQWFTLLRLIDSDLGRRQDVALLPLGQQLGQLGVTQPGWSAVPALAQAAREVGVERAPPWDGKDPASLLDFFAFLLSYRAHIVYGGPRRPEFSERFAELWRCALREVLASPTLFGNLRLVHAHVRPEGAASELAWSWQDLTGPANVPLTDSIIPAHPDVQPGTLYFAGPGALVPLAPFSSYQEDDLGRGAVGILHEIVRRTRRKGQRQTEEIISADYLDYATGETLKGQDAAEALAGLLARLRGQHATPDDVQAAQERSAAAKVGPSEVVTADAALGDFELLGEIGRGGMGIVYRARQRSLRRIVALKVLPPALAADDTLAQRFRREIATLGRCSHPHIVSILGSGVDQARLYYAMEYIDGADLTNLDPRPQAPRLIELFADAALGLAQLHQQGIVHRDLKPANLMLTRDGQRMVITDLGLARVLDASKELTRSQGQQIGTLRYMAPELLEGQPADFRSDLYAFAASLYEVFAGHPVYDGNTETRLRQQILTEPPPPLRRYNSEVSADLATVLSVAMARDPAARYQSAQALAADLRAVAEDRPIAARPPSRLHRARLYIRRRPGTAALGLLVLLGALTTALTYWQWNRELVDYYAGYLERWGVWEGIGPVRAWQQHHRDATYRFVRQHNHLVRVERVNGSGRLVNDDEKEAQWQFHYEAESGRLVQIWSQDQFGTSRRRYDFSKDLRQQRLFDAYDQPSPKQKTDVSLIRREFDASGLLVKVSHANFFGVSRTDGQGAYGYQYTLNERGLRKRVRVLGPDGLPSLTKEEAGTRSFAEAEALGALGGRPSNGKLSDRAMLDRDGIAGWTTAFDQSGNAIEQSYFGAAEQPVQNRDGITTRRRSYDSFGNMIGERYFGSTGSPVSDLDEIHGWSGTYDERGNEIERRYLGVDNRPTLHKERIAGWRAKYDEQGQKIELVYFGLRVEPTLDKDGIAGWRAKYDYRGRPVEHTDFGTNGKPTWHHNDHAGWQAKYDERNHPIEISFLGPDGKLKNDYFSVWRDKYDERDHPIEHAFFGSDGKPALHKKSIAGWRSKFDEYGHEIERAFFGIHGEPTLDDEGIAGGRTVYDERGRVTEHIDFGIDGRPAWHNNDHAGWRAKYDERDNPIERLYLDPAGRPTLIDEGYAETRSKYDERGNEIEQTQFGIDGKPILNQNGYASWRTKYDERGHAIEKAYFGIDGKPTLYKDGYASWRTQFDERGHEIETVYLGIDGKPTLSTNGNAGYRSTFDERGHEIELIYFGLDGKPTLVAGGYAQRRSKFDERGHEIEKIYFGVDDKLTLYQDGYASWRTQFDERGHEIETAYFGMDGKPTLHRHGNAGYRSRFDERGHEIETAYFGIDGKPTLHKDGHAGYRSRFDERGHVIEKAYFGIDGKPTLHKDGNAGYRSRFDQRGHEIERSYFGIDGKPTLLKGGYASWRTQFDERGREIEKAWFGDDGKPTRLEDGYHGYRSRFDERGHEIEKSYFGSDGKPALHKDGFVSRRTQFDERGHEIETIFLGINGKPTLQKNGIAGYRSKFDERGNEIEKAYFGIDGKPTLHKDGFVSWRTQFDERGHEIETVFLGINGKPALHKDGIAGYRSKFDERGHEVEKAYFGIDGRPTLHKDGIASWRSQFDERGNTTERHFFGMDGKPILDKDGYAGYSSRFDERGRKVEHSYLGLDGKLLRAKDGYAGWRSVFDEWSRETERRYFGADGSPALLKDGYAGYRSRFDPHGNEVERDFLGSNGQPTRNKLGKLGWHARYDQWNHELGREDF